MKKALKNQFRSVRALLFARRWAGFVLFAAMTLMDVTDAAAYEYEYSKHRISQSLTVQSGVASIVVRDPSMNLGKPVERQCALSRLKKDKIYLWVHADSEFSILHVYCEGWPGTAGMSISFETCGDARKAAAALGVDNSRVVPAVPKCGTPSQDSSKAARAAAPSPESQPTRQPDNEVKICPDGTPVTARGCPTQVLNFPGKEGLAKQKAQKKEKEEEDARRQAAAAKERARQKVEQDRAELDAAMDRLLNAPPSGWNSTWVTPIRDISDGLDWSQPVRVYVGPWPEDPPRRGMIDRLWNWMADRANRTVNALPGCNADLFNRSACRTSLFGIFHVPGSTEDIHDSMLDVTEGAREP